MISASDDYPLHQTSRPFRDPGTDRNFYDRFFFCGYPTVGVERGATYFAVAFGALCGYYLPYGAHFDWRVDYLPAVDNFTKNYLLRSDASLTVPLMDPLNAKFGFLDEYNGNPAPDAQPNSLFLTAGLSIAW